MRTQKLLVRMSAALAVGGLVFGQAGISVAWAQLAPAAAPVPAAGDPPGRVGRLARMQGTVSFHDVGEAQWVAATLNYPVTSGNAFWTQPGSAADFEVGATRVSMDQATEFDVDALDDTTLAATLAQGAVYLDVNALESGENYQLRTPRGLVTIAQPGRYEVVAGDTEHPTMVTVVDGAATITGDNLNVTVNARQTAQVAGAANFQASVGPEQNDNFLVGFLAPPPAAPAPAYTPPPMVLEMTGGDALQETGSWAPTPDYGEVWYPPVQAGWVPYREGHWAYVAPWGWTWVDNAPWGFAPFHYGRWVQVGPRWGWIPVAPGIAEGPGAGYGRPVYSPALVSFVGLGAGVAVGAAIGASVGWIPLGPREAYYPPYHVSETYLRRVNVTSVRNVTEIRNVTHNNVVINNFVNCGGATMVPAAAMAGSQPIAQHAQRVTPEMLAGARPVAAVPVRPTAVTRGGRPVAPGPVVRPEGGRGSPVVLRAPVVSNGANGGQVARPGEVGRPDMGRPDVGRVGVPGPAIVPHEGEPAGHGLPPLRADVPGRAPGMARPGEVARPGEPGRPAAPEARPGIEPPHTEAGGVGRPPVAARPAEMPHAASPAPRPEPRPEPRPAASPGARPEAHAEPRFEPHSAPRPEARPEARPESRPGMQHVAAPSRPAPQRREEERRP